MSDTKLTVPTVHLNGTGKAGLIKQYEEAGSALYEAISKLRATAPAWTRLLRPEGPCGPPEGDR
jgi:hypothetical protein